MSVFTNEDRRYIVSEVEKGSTISEIAKAMDRRYQTIRSAVRSAWFKKLKNDTPIYTEKDYRADVGLLF